MKDMEPWISVIVAIVYMICKNWINIVKQKSDPTYSPAWEDQDDIEIGSEIESEIEAKAKKAKCDINKNTQIPNYTKEILNTKPNICTTPKPTNNNKAHINTPVYPGIKKLLLPIHEQDPYKLYKMANHSSTKNLNQLINKYSNTRKIIIMSELFNRKF